MTSEDIPGDQGDGPPTIVIQEALAAAAAAEKDDTSKKPSASHHHQHQHQHQHGNAAGEAFPSVEDVPPPPYNGAEYGQLDISQNGLDTGARVAADGRVNIKINQRSRKLTNLLVPALRHQLDLQEDKIDVPIPPGLGEYEGLPPPPMNIVIQIVGSRGDVQPFVALGQVLKTKYNHRVRIATHPTFRDFITENGLEFFSIGGDPAELMAFMVKNPGLMPGFDSLKNGDIGKRRKGIYEIITGCWRSCIEAGDGTGIQVSDDHLNHRSSFENGINMAADPLLKPFVADAIIANPPSFAHMHIAEKLGIPLHLMFTMPWSPTQAFPHPLANLVSSNADSNMTNFVTYALVDMLTWQGLGDVINRFREKSLGLEPVSIMWAPGMSSRLRIPWTYCWSPALIPKPRDWGNYIDISGFFFLNLASNFTPPQDLADFLAAGPPPVYIGFGSIVVDDPNGMTKMIFEAVKKTGQRALVSKGWGGLGGDELGVPEEIFMLGNIPHDWLFKHVSCVVHHGGAGTTAAGISAGRPTVVVPFFGDQPFWGAMTARAGAGPMPVPFKVLTADKLAAAIMEALKPESLERAAELSDRIKQEKGTESGADSFHKQLHLDDLRCTLYPKNTAVWRVKRTDIRLSALAATVLGNEGLLDFTDLKLYRPREYETEDGPWDPISGGAAALIGTIGNLTMGVADFPVEILKSLKTSTNDVREHRKDKPEGSGSGSVSTSRDQSTTDLTPLSPPLSRRSMSNEHLSLQSTATTVADSSAVSTDDSRDQTESSLVTSPTDLTLVETPSSATATRKPSAIASVFSSDGPPHRRWSRHGSRSGSRHGSRSGSPFPKRDESPCPGEEIGHITAETAIGGAKAVGKIVSAGMKSPMDFTMSLAKGFHNAPKLYGDDTVRKTEKITGLQSGLRAAAQEFGFGFYDGITGLVTQPLAGAKKEGAAGFMKGAAKGIGGLILKPGAAIWGLPGYSFKGIYAELQKHFGSSVQNYIIAARTAQGYEEWRASTAVQRLEIITAWKSSKIEMRRAGKKYGKEREEEIQHHISRTATNDKIELLSGFKNTRHLSWDERKALADQKQKVKREEKELKRQQTLARTGSNQTTQSGKIKSRCKICPFDHEPDYHLRHTSSFPSVDHPPSYGRSADRDLMHPEFEEAIQKSVTATSRGIPEEDALIERALRASMLELQKAQTATSTSTSASVAEQEAYERAVKASVAEVKRARAEERLGQSQQEQGVIRRSGDAKGSVEPPELQAMSDEEEDHELTRALTQSLEHYKIEQAARDGAPGSSSASVSTGHHRHFHHQDPDGREWSDSDDSGMGTEEDEEFKKTLEESKRIHTENEVKKQQQQQRGPPPALPMRADVAAGAATGNEHEDDHDEELKRAITESQKHAEDTTRQRTEEEIVLEYVKKQSLLEEEARRKMTEKEADGGQQSVKEV